MRRDLWISSAVVKAWNKILHSGHQFSNLALEEVDGWNVSFTKYIEARIMLTTGIDGKLRVDGALYDHGELVDILEHPKIDLIGVHTFSYKGKCYEVEVVEEV